jgi:molybdate transport system substrate-binding protein
VSRPWPCALVVLLLAILTFGCVPAQKTEINISAAASLTDAIKEINSLYMQENSGIKITANFGGSGTLQKQIESGAPTDVFISSAASQMDALQKGKLIIDDTRKNLLFNKVVLIVPAGNPLGITDFKGLTSDKVTKIAIGDPKSVPAGTYGQQVFDRFAISDVLKSKLVLAGDVRQVLTYVESGNVEAGVVYLTDARTSSRVSIAANAPDDINAKIVYPVAVIKASMSADAARAYEKYLFGSRARAVFEKYGFTMAG